MRREKSKKIRIYELAKRLDMPSKDLLKELSKYGLDDVTSHMSTLEPDVAELVIAEYQTQKEEREEIQEKTGRKRKEKKAWKDKTEVKEEDEFEVEEINEEERLSVQGGISVRQLAKKLGLKGTEMVAVLMRRGIMAGINQRLDYEALSVIADDFNFIPERKQTLEERLLVEETEEDEENSVPRAPVVTIMGHVDHGKTSLLDAVRDANVMDSEAGGITQHIGAYHVEFEGKNIVFIDTPGHEAFTAMRARGAKVTDIVVLIVAADDGVMPQTVEAINHAKAAGVPILVTINKIDKKDAMVDRTKQQLTEYGLIPEDWGGDHIFVEISAKNKTGIKYLLEMLLLEAELLELTANPNKNARGTVIEAQIDNRRGPIGTVLVQSGTLRVGDVFVAGLYDGKTRAMINDKGEYVTEAGPSTPVEVLGFSNVPEAGDPFYALDDEKDAKTISESRQAKYRLDALAPSAMVSLANLYDQIKEGSIKELNIILKGDVQGSVQAISETLQELSTDEVKLNIIHQAVGAITETDIMLASASNAIVIGFNINPSVSSRNAAKREHVDIRVYDVIYELISDVLAAMEGLLEPDTREVVLGRAAVRELFDISSIGRVAGCYVTNGRMMRNENLRVIRDNHVVFEGKVNSLRRFKDNVNEVTSGYECGISVNDFNSFEIDDILECYTLEQVARKLR